MGLHDVRDKFEHGFLPECFFKDKDRFIITLLDRSDYGYRVLDGLLREQGFGNPYNEDQFGNDTLTLEDGAAVTVMTMPTPIEPGEAVRIYLAFTSDFSRMAYYTAEKTTDGEHLFVRDAEGNVEDLGPCVTADASDFLQLAEHFTGKPLALEGEES